MYILGNLIIAIVNILDMVLSFYSIIVIASAVISWVNPDPYNPIVRILRQLTEPVYRYLRKYIPQAGGFDLTPIAVILIIMFIRVGILTSLATFAHSLV